MHEPHAILDQIRARYRRNWRDWLLDGSDAQFSFPLAAPSAHIVAGESDAVGRWLQNWRSWSQAHPASRLHSTTRRTVIGNQDVFTHLILGSIGDLVGLDQDLAEHWDRANARWARVRPMAESAAGQRLRPYLQQIVDLADLDFEILLNAAAWFNANPASGLTIRQVPVPGMHTKWLARNRRLVLACLNITERADSGMRDHDGLEQADLDPLGLKALPAHIDVILADPADRTLVGGLRHLRAPLPEIAALPIRPATVLIVENKESAYLVPDRCGMVVVHSLGNHLNILNDISWLVGVRHLYWGDLDRAGFTLLSRARTQLPSIASIMMDLDTFDAHKNLAVVDTARADLPETNLTTEEIAALGALVAGDGTCLRLEQERLASTFVLEQLGLI